MDNAVASASRPADNWRYRLGRSKNFTLFALTFTFTIGFVDRQLLNLLVEPIRKDLGLTDVEISLLQGAAFSIAYLVMSPVFGRLVDTRNRKQLLLTCAVIWTTFTAGCGLAGSFLMLFAARSMVGGAEAGLTPSAWSILTGRFDENELPRAFSIYHLGTYVGSGLAMVLGGAIFAWISASDWSGVPLLGAMAPWQMTFLAVALLGVPCILLIAIMAEPPRNRFAESETTAPPLGEAFAALWQNRSFYIPFYVGMAMAVIPIYAFAAWIPTLAVRQFGVAIGDVGILYGTVALTAGSLGVLSAPFFAGILAKLGFGADMNVRIPAICTFLITVCCIALAFRQSYFMTIAIAGVAGFIYAVPSPLATSALQIATPPALRGLASGIYIVTITLMGLGIAPVAVALLTEEVFRDPNRVGDSLAIVCGVSAATGGIALLMALGPYRKMRERKTV